ncbi:Smr domain-containing protein [Pustulibacterium marinum]|uniref:Smr domain-containing protein n=1 Tax=Pustulibacterium marinum TaxID=1224947 RepID=A0A1I7FBZ4_9FLAO|nr:Smr/MutS family protein [Pustulibacterium marinum]SFU33694.1 Smr domain-containing protein [Pustulibacterium marinum]
MKIKKGDYVEVIDEPMSGKVLKFNGKMLTIESDEGFELVYHISEVVVVNEGFEVKNYEVSSALKHKQGPKRKKSVSNSRKERYQPQLEVDLHIQQLVKDYARLSNYDMLTIQLDTAERQLKFAIQKGIQKVVFIHGVGAGVLKTELEYLFGRYSNVTFQEADYGKYGLGATEIYIHQNG